MKEQSVKKVDNTDLPMGIVPRERGPVCLHNHCKNQKRTCAHIQHILKLSTGDVPEIYIKVCYRLTSEGTNR